MKSFEYIDLAKEKEKLTSYKLAQKTGISESSLSQYKNKKRMMDDFACFKIAEILCIDPRKIVARANEEREKDEEKKEFWKDRIKEYGYITLKMQMVILSLMGTASLFYLIVISLFFGSDIPNNIYYVK